MSAGDDDKTPPRGTRPTRRERIEHAKRYPPIAPVVAGLDGEPSGVVAQRFDDLTSPIEMFERPPQPAEIEVARRLRRDSDNPGAMMERLTDAVSRLTVRLDKQQRTERSNNEERANQLLELLGRVPGDAAAELRAEFDDKLDDLSITLDDGKKIGLFDAVKNLLRDASFGKWVMRTVAGAALTVLVYVGQQISSRSEQQGEMRVKVDHLEAEVSLLRTENASLRAMFYQRDQQPRGDHP